MSLGAVAGLRPVRVLRRRRGGRGRGAAGAGRLRDRRAVHARPLARARLLLDPGRAGAVLRRRAVRGLDRAHRPAGRRHADADGLDRRAAGDAARGHARAARPHGRHDARAPSGAPTHSCKNWCERRSRHRAARSTCWATMRWRAISVEETARQVLERAGYERIETPTFEATDLFARGVGESTDVVQKEMYTFEEAGSESVTLRPEGTAPVCRAYLEHGMHKLPQPVKLWYLSSFFRRERPQKGRYRQFWQIGAEAIGSDDPAVDAESILLLSEILESLGARELRLRISSLGTPALARRLPRGADRLPARQRGRALARGPPADQPQPAARVRRRSRGHAQGDGRRAAAARPPRRRRLRALRPGQGAARRRGRRLGRSMESLFSCSCAT